MKPVTMTLVLTTAFLVGLAPVVCAQEGPAERSATTDPLLTPIAEGLISYELATTGVVQQSSTVALAPKDAGRGSRAAYYEQRSVREGAALVNFIKGLQVATDAYLADLISFCETQAEEADIPCEEGQFGMSCEEYLQQEREYLRLRCLGNEQIPPDITAGLAVMTDLQDFLLTESAVLGGGVLDREIALAEAIADNMASGLPSPPYNDEGIEGPWSVPGVVTLGATPGGAQDIGYIREVVANGYVPLPFHLAAEGLLSEHNLPLTGDQPCDQLLCITTAVAVAPAFDTGEMSRYLQVGFSTNLSPETFERPALNLAVVVDKSGSMADHMGSDEISKMDAVNLSLSKMVDRLDERDRLAIVVFTDTARVLVESTIVTEPAAIQSRIAGITAGGSTCIDCGLQLGYGIVSEHSDPAQRLDRVILLTDALPNVGRTGEGSFVAMVTEGAEQGIGLTTLGVGFNFGQELILTLSRLRGGNYFFLETLQRIDEIFSVDFDYLVTPVAYDLSMQLQVPKTANLAVRKLYGVSGGSYTSDLVEMQVSTLFLSRNHGAILVELSPEGPQLRAPAGRRR